MNNIQHFLSFLNWYYAYQNPKFYEMFDNFLQLLNIALVLGALIYAERQYRLAKKEKADRERPFVYLDLDIEHNLCTLIIKNAGGSPAKNLHIKFSPTIKLHNEDINDLPLFNGMPFLAVDKEMKLFMGSLLGEDNVKNNYDVSLIYTDIYGNKYVEKQIVDPSRYMGISRIERKGIHDIAKSLEEIAKKESESEDHLEDITRILKEGIIIRNKELNSYSSEELLKIIKNSYQFGNKESLEYYPGLYDMQILLRVAKDKLLSKSKITKRDKEIIKCLDELMDFRFYAGYGDKYQQKWEKLMQILK